MRIALPQARFRVKTLFAAITGAAAVLSLSRFSASPVAAGIVLAMICSLAIAIVGAIWGAKRWAQACAGFALCAGPYLFLLPPEEEIVSHYQPVSACLDSTNERIISWLPMPKTDGTPSWGFEFQYPSAAVDPSTLFPMTGRQYAAVDNSTLGLGTGLPSAAVDAFALGLGLEIEPTFMAIDPSALGIGTGPPSMANICSCTAYEPPSPMTAVQHCFSTLLVGICGAATVCWLQRPQGRT